MTNVKNKFTQVYSNRTNSKIRRVRRGARHLVKLLTGVVFFGILVSCSSLAKKDKNNLLEIRQTSDIEAIKGTGTILRPEPKDPTMDFQPPSEIGRGNRQVIRSKNLNINSKIFSEGRDVLIMADSLSFSDGGIVLSGFSQNAANGRNGSGFGNSGRDGITGKDAGDIQIIVRNLKSLNISSNGQRGSKGGDGVRGRNGEDGNNGSHGRDAMCPPPRRVVGTSGGDGGDGTNGSDGGNGGDGGDGGDAGNIVIKFLKSDINIPERNAIGTILARGASGGAPGSAGSGGLKGEGGSGGRGGDHKWCERCGRRGNCVEFKVDGGPSGSNGIDGRNGRRGRAGRSGDQGSNGTIEVVKYKNLAEYERDVARHR